MEVATERNKQIYEDRKKGATLVELQEKYQVTAVRVREIVRREKQKEENESNEVYAVLISLCDDEKFVTRTYTVLQRIGATTVEELLKLDQKQVKKARNCGPLMQELIMKMKEEIEKKYVS